MNRLAVILSTVALLVSGLAAFGSWRSPRHGSPQPDGPDNGAELEDLRRRVSLLGRQMEALKIGLAVRSVSLARGSDPATANPSGDLGTNLGALSQRLAELEQQTEAARRMGMLPGPLSPAEFAKATTTALDRHADVGQRVAALGLLRPVKGRVDGRTPEVTTAMIELVESPDTSPKHRADIIRQLSEVDHPALKNPLVAALSRDADGDTRREAVETLKPFFGDPEVFALVTRLKGSDPDPHVRFEAERRLGEWQADQNKRR